MLKIIQQSLLLYLKREMLEVQAGFRKRRGNRDHIANIRWILERTKKHQNEVHFCFIDYSKAFDSVHQGKMSNVLKEMSVQQHLIVLMSNLYPGQEAATKTEYGKIEWFPIGKGVRQGCTLSMYLFHLYAERIIREAELDEDEGKIKIGGRKVNNLRYADDTTLLIDKPDDLTRLVKKLKDESARAGLQQNLKKNESNGCGNDK